MTQALWNIDLQGNIAASVETTQPLAGLGSVRLTAGNAGTSLVSATPLDATGWPKGVVHGRLRQAFKVTGDVSAAFPNNFVGLYGLATADHPTLTSSEWFALYAEYNRLTLRRGINQILISNPLLLAEVPWTFPLGTVFTLQLVWERRSASEVALEVWRGTQLNFSDLTQVLTYVATGSQADYGSLVAVAEGAWLRQTAVGSGLMTVWWDNTILDYQP